MVNLEHKLTVDDLIIEYMIYKVKNGYEPSFLASEFINFLIFFESKMPVLDSIYDEEKLFTRFFKRMGENGWSRTISLLTEEKIAIPHMDIVYNKLDDDYLITANYKLSDYDQSIINTYFMNDGKYGSKNGEVFKIRSIIGEYLSKQPKRTIDENVKIDENDLIIGQYISAEIISIIWKNHIKELIKKHRWPEQCTDLDTYLLKMDLAEIIGLKSIKKDLLDLFNEFSKRIAILYHQDHSLKISTFTYGYLARANYDLLIKDYEEIMSANFEDNGKTLNIDLSQETVTESHKIEGTYFWDEDADVRVTTNKIGNDVAKNLVKSLINNN